MTVSIARSSARSRPWARLTSCAPLDKLVDQLVEFQLGTVGELQGPRPVPASMAGM